MAEKSCTFYGSYVNSSSLRCVPLNRCPTILDDLDALSDPRVNDVCGFDKESQILMICCPEDLVTDPLVSKFTNFSTSKRPLPG